jgi:Ca2+-binding RTX toxin-like protein
VRTGAAGNFDIIDLDGGLLAGDRGNDGLDFGTFQSIAFVKNVETISASAVKGRQDVTLGTDATGVSIDLGGSNTDTLHLGNFNNDAVVRDVETIFGNNGSDTINAFGAGSRMDVYGGAGNDNLVAHGNAALVGGAGVDQLTGGTSATTFSFGTGDAVGAPGAADRITDFQPGVDHIDLFQYGVVGGVDTFALGFAGEDAVLAGNAPTVGTHIDAAPTPPRY